METLDRPGRSALAAQVPRQFADPLDTVEHKTASGSSDVEHFEGRAGHDRHPDIVFGIDPNHHVDQQTDADRSDQGQHGQRDE